MHARLCGSPRSGLGLRLAEAAVDGDILPQLALRSVVRMPGVIPGSSDVRILSDELHPAGLVVLCRRARVIVVRRDTEVAHLRGRKYTDKGLEPAHSHQGLLKKCRSV